MFYLTTVSVKVKVNVPVHAMDAYSGNRGMIRYDVFVNCNWVDTRWQQYSTHLHTNNTQNNTVKQNKQRRTYITIRIHKQEEEEEEYTTIKIHNLQN
jgi:hypothetical protein